MKRLPTVSRFLQSVLVIPWLFGALLVPAYGSEIFNTELMAICFGLAMICFVLAIALRGPRPVAIVLLSSGLAARSISEIGSSVAKTWIEESSNRAGEFPWLALFYLCTFVIPALILLDWLRKPNPAVAPAVGGAHS